MLNRLHKPATFGLLRPLLLLYLILQFCFPILAGAQDLLEGKNILILHSFAHAQPVYKIIDQSLTDCFVSSGLDFNNLYLEFLDLARSPGPDYRKELVDMFRTKYQRRNIDLAVAVHQQALEFLLKEGRDFYPEGPIICILGDSTPPGHSDSERPIVYLPFSFDVISTVKAILALRPDTERLLVIAGSIPSSDGNPGMYREEAGRDGILEKEGKMEYFED